MGRMIFGSGGFGDALGLAIDVGHGQRPERNQIDAGDEFGKERWQKFPVPAEQVNQDGSDAEIEQVIGGRESSGYKQGEDYKLECIRNDGQHHGGSKVWAG